MTDFYKAKAAEMFNVSEADVTPEQRQKAKQKWYYTFYGMNNIDLPKNKAMNKVAKACVDGEWLAADVTTKKWSGSEAQPMKISRDKELFVPPDFSKLEQRIANSEYMAEVIEYSKMGNNGEPINDPAELTEEQIKTLEGK